MTSARPGPRIGVGFSRGLAPPDVVECVKLAEELGYESAWMAEGHGGEVRKGGEAPLRVP